MNVRSLKSPAGIATPMRSGGWVVDLGAAPYWVSDRATARAELGIPGSPTGSDDLSWSPSNDPVRSGSTPAEVRS
jgi:hypothetical protein